MKKKKVKHFLRLKNAFQTKSKLCNNLKEIRGFSLKIKSKNECSPVRGFKGN